MFTTADLDRMARDDRWLGHGYIGHRESTKASVASGEITPRHLDVLAEADRLVLEAANREGLDADLLFHWANSKDGRWYGDCVSGGISRRAADLLPSVYRRHRYL